MRTIIIDDEPNAREKLAFLVKRFCPQIEIVAVCKNAEEGIVMIESLKPELIFLDVEMPLMSGFDMLNALQEIKFEVIFTTAYDQYAIKAIKHSALDYLLKPIDAEQLQVAVEKALQKKSASNVSSPHLHALMENIRHAETDFTHLAIPTIDGFVFVQPQNIIRMESDGRYTTLFLNNSEKIVASRNIGEFEEMLPESVFLRIHHSHLINISHVKRYIKSEGGQILMSDNAILEISRRKKEEVLLRLIPK